MLTTLSINVLKRSGYYLLPFLMLIGSKTIAQSTYKLGALPAISLNKKLPSNWELNFKMTQRFLFSAGTFRNGAEQQADHVLSDYALLFGKKAGLNSKFNAGYQIRFRDGSIFHRGIQQFTTVRKFNGFKLAHRLASDQTYSHSKQPVFRLRYRLGTEVPLNGQSVDYQEWYLKLTNEYLHIFESADYELELRLGAVAGYLVNDRSKLEFGLDYRINSFLNSPPQHLLRAIINWYYSI